jgi:hypothetical protein
MLATHFSCDAAGRLMVEAYIDGACVVDGQVMTSAGRIP